MTGPYAALATSVASGNGSALQTPVPPALNASFPADEESVASARSLVRAWLEHCRADDWARDEIASAVADACSDVVERVRPGTPIGRVVVTADVEEHELCVTVTDAVIERRPREDGSGAPAGPRTLSARSTAVLANAGKEGAAVLLTFRPAAALRNGPSTG